jgi:hypothetical protein
MKRRHHLISNQTTTILLEEFEFSINGAPHTADLSIVTTPHGGTRIICPLGRRRYNILIEEVDLARHLAFSINRSAKDVTLGQPHVRNGRISNQVQALLFDDLELRVGQRVHTIRLTIEINPNNGVEISFMFNQKPINIHVPEIPLVRHLGAIAGRAAMDARHARRFL